MDHPNVINIVEVYEDTRNFYIVTELCEGGELFDFIIETKSLSEPLAANIMR